MNLKFYVQHDQTPGLRNGKIQPGRESKMAADTKNSKANKINIFFRLLGIFGRNFERNISGTLVFSNFKMITVCC